MATSKDLDAILTSVAASVQAEVSSVSLAITEATNAISRLLAKIAAGTPSTNDLQPEIDQLKAIQTTIDGANTSLVSAIATFKVEGN